MSTPSLEDILAQVMLDDGWTCEYHEPDADCGQCCNTVARTVGLMLAEIREHWHVVEKAPVVTSEDGSARIPVETDRPQDNPHLRIEPVDQWGDRIIRPLGIPDPYRGPIKARRLAAALLSAADVAEAQS